MYSFSDNSDIRKIQFTGKSTYILSLPKKWVHDLHLKSGDPLKVVREPDNSLSIISDVTRFSFDSIEESTIYILNDETVNSLKRKLVSIYLAGFNVINLKTRLGRIDPILREATRELVRKNLVGTEIIADSSDLISIQVLIRLPELSVNTAIRRMYLIASSMHKDAMISLSELNTGLATAVIRSDDEVDRFSLYVLRNLMLATKNSRILGEIGLKNISDCLSYRYVVKSIERIADHASNIAEKCLLINDVFSSEIIKDLQKLSEFSLMCLTESVESFLRRDYKIADKIIDKVEEVTDLEKSMLLIMDDTVDNTSSKNIMRTNVKLITNDIKRTAEYASDIAEETLNLTIGDIISVEKRPLAIQEKFHDVQDQVDNVSS